MERFWSGKTTKHRRRRRRYKPGCHYGLKYVLAATVTGFNPCAGNFNFERVEEIEAQITAYREEEFLPGVDAIQARAVASAEAAAERASAEAAAERAATEAAAGPAGTAEEPAV